MKVVEHKAGRHGQKGSQPEQRFRAVGHQRNRLFRGDMKTADESGQSTLQSGYGFVCAGEYPYFPVYFACPGEDFKVAPRPLSCPPSVSTVEGEGHAAWLRSNPAAEAVGTLDPIIATCKCESFY